MDARFRSFRCARGDPDRVRSGWMRPSRTVAGAALTAALVIGALPGLVGSFEPSKTRDIDAAAFDLINLATTRDRQADGQVLPDSAGRSEGALDGAEVIEEPGALAGRAGERADPSVPDAEGLVGVEAAPLRPDGRRLVLRPRHHGHADPARDGDRDLRRRWLHRARRDRLRAVQGRRAGHRHVPAGLLQDLRLRLVVRHRPR